MRRITTLLLMLTLAVVAYAEKDLNVNTATFTYSYRQDIKNPVDCENYYYSNFPSGYKICGVEQIALTWSGTFNSTFKYYLLPTENIADIEYIYSDDNYEVGSKINGRTILARSCSFNLPYAPSASSIASQADRNYYFSPDGDTYSDTDFFTSAGYNSGYFGPTAQERKPSGYYMYKYCVAKQKVQYCTFIEGEYFFRQNSPYGNESMYDAGGGVFTTKGVDCTSVDDRYIWILTKGKEGGYYICNKSSGLYLTSNVSTLSSRSLALKSTPEEFFFSIYTHDNGYQGCYTVQSKAMIAINESMDAAGDNNEVISYPVGNDNETSAWELAPNFGWRYNNSNKTLYIDSNSAMIDYYEMASRPWHYITGAIQNIVISENVTYISKWAFGDCTAVTKVTIPSRITAIEEYAFHNCNALRAVYINDLSAWCKIDFSNADACPTNYAHNLYLNGELITELVIPSDITRIKSQAFRGCSCITKATIHDGVTTLGEYSFNTCTGMTSIKLPSGITTIPRGIFSGCNSLQDVTIPRNVTIISSSSFWGCNLESIIIPSNVTSIGDVAFYNCNNLKTVINLSGLDIVAGSTEYGYVAYKAENVWREHYPIFDDKALNYGNIKDYTKFNYNRTFNNTDWQAWYMPFDVQLSDIESELEVAYLNDVHQFDDDKDGWIDRTELEAITLVDGTLLANYPYIVRAKSAGEKNFIFDNVTVEPFEENSIDCSSVTTKFTFTGSNNAIKNNGHYALENNTLTTATSKIFTSNDVLTSLSQLDNDKVYTLRSARTFLLYSSNTEVADKLCAGNGTKVNSVSYNISDINQQFKIENINNQYYLYCIAAGKYVNKSGAYVETPTDALTFTNVGGKYQWKLCIGGNGLNSQEPNRTKEGVIFDSWTTTDAGNCYIIEEISATHLQPNRWYLSIEARNAMFKAPEQIRLFITEGDVTGIDEVKSENGKLKGEGGEIETIYDLSGRKVENPTKGIYIVDGKKVLVK